MDEGELNKSHFDVTITLTNEKDNKINSQMNKDKEVINPANYYTKLFLQEVPSLTQEDYIFTCFLFNFSQRNQIPPLSIIDVLTEMVMTKNELFNNFLDREGSFDSLLDHLIPMINLYNSNDPTFNEKQIHIMHSITILLTEYTDKIGRVVDFLKRFFSILVLLFQSHNANKAVAAFRYATLIYEKCNLIVPKKIRLTWIYRMLSYSPPSSPVHYLAVNFIKNNPHPDIMYITMCKILVRQGLDNIDSLQSLEFFMSLATEEDPLEIYIHLFRILIDNSFLGGVVADVISNTLTTFQDDIDLLKSIIFFLRKCILFVIFSQNNGKYVNKSLLIKKLVYKILLKKIQFLNEAIVKILNALRLNNFEFKLPSIKGIDLNPDDDSNDTLVDAFLNSKRWQLIDNDHLKLFAKYPYTADIDNSLIDNSDEYDYSFGSLSY